MEGPRLVYVDPSNGQVKGEIPITEESKCELKSFRNLDIRTPNRTFHLIDRGNNAQKWYRRIVQVQRHHYPASAALYPSS